jgi:predicted N-acyltransferase
MNEKFLTVRVHNSLSSINRNQWNNVVRQSKLGSFFQTYEWLKAIEEGLGLEARHVVVSKNNNVVAIFPNFLVKIGKTPFYQLVSVKPGFGGPVIVGGNEEQVLSLMLKTTSRICGRKIISHRISAIDHGYIRYGVWLQKAGFRPSHAFCRFTINLKQDSDTIMSQMEASRRNQIRKGLKQAFKIQEEDIDHNCLRGFHASYKNTIASHEASAYPFIFFTSLLSSARNRIKIFSISVNEKKVGSHLVVLDDEQSAIHSFCTGIDAVNFKFYPKELLDWHIMNWGIGKGYETFDSGATSADFRDGIFQFKEEFGGRLVPTFTSEKVFNKAASYFLDSTRSIRSRYRRITK